MLLESSFIIYDELIKMNPLFITIGSFENTKEEWLEIYFTRKYLQLGFSEEKFSKIIYFLKLYYPNYFSNQSTMPFLIKAKEPLKQMEIRQAIISKYSTLKKIEHLTFHKSKIEYDLNELEAIITPLLLKKANLLSQMTEINKQLKNIQSDKDFIENNIPLADFCLKLFEPSNYKTEKLKACGFNASSLLIEIKDQKFTKENMTYYLPDIETILDVKENENVVIRNILDLDFNFYELTYEIKRKYKRKEALNNDKGEESEKEEKKTLP